jgi:hypothetical protein
MAASSNWPGHTNKENHMNTPDFRNKKAVAKKLPC